MHLMQQVTINAERKKKTKKNYHINNKEKDLSNSHPKTTCVERMYCRLVSPEDPQTGKHSHTMPNCLNSEPEALHKPICTSTLSTKFTD